MEKLFEKLDIYAKSDFYPFHMPGHKRNIKFAEQFPGMSIDITEINGFDNLHHPEGILKELQKNISELYGVQETFISVNGSTAGLLSAISASVKSGGKILIARNCHKAVYHAIYLRNLIPYYVYPHLNLKSGLNGGISPLDVDNILKNEKGIEAVLITSPTYDGMVSDVKRIAEVVHKYNIPLIVDEAHGAHFIFSNKFPESSVNLGADIVIQSWHKTLPSLTQTALLHKVTKRVEKEKIARFMGIYQSSSPSYLLMASMDFCYDFLKNYAAITFEEYIEELITNRKELEKLNNIRLITEAVIGEYEIFDYDISKIILSVKDCNITGPQLHQIFREKYHLEMEMETDSYVLALTSIGDTKQGMKRLVEAIKDIDLKLSYDKQPDVIIENLNRLKQELMPTEAMDEQVQEIKLIDSEGKISSEFVYLYPPGIPLLVPGERISLQLIQDMRKYQKLGLELQGLCDYTGENIRVVKEK